MMCDKALFLTIQVNVSSIQLLMCGCLGANNMISDLLYKASW